MIQEATAPSGKGENVFLYQKKTESSLQFQRAARSETSEILLLHYAHPVLARCRGGDALQLLCTQVGAAKPCYAHPALDPRGKEQSKGINDASRGKR